VATEEGAQSRLDDIIDSVVRDQVSSSELIELVRNASLEIPEAEVLKEVPAERMEKELRQIRSTAYRQVQELRGEADAEASRIYGAVVLSKYSKFTG